MASQFVKLPQSLAGVSSLNGLSGVLTLVPGTGISIAPSGSEITISATGLIPTFSDSLVENGGIVTLVNDSAAPGDSKYYGTNASGVLGYYALPSSGTGTVTSVSVVTTNGFAGTVATATTTPAITISTSVTGILYGNGTSVAAAIASNFPTLNQNTTGTAANITATTNSTLTSLTGLTTASSLSSVGTITSGIWHGTPVAVPYGGTGLTSLTANAVVLGNGVSSPNFVAAGNIGNILTDNGTTWISVPATAGALYTNIFSWSASNVALTATGPFGLYQQVMINGGPDDQLMSLPDATTLPLYWTCNIVNNGNNYNQIDLYLFDQTTFLTNIFSFSQTQFLLVDNTTTNGTWQSVSGVPTGASWGATSGINLGSGGMITSNGGGVGTTAAIGFNEYFSIINGTGNEILIAGAPMGDSRHWEINDNDNVTALQIDFRTMYDINGDTVAYFGANPFEFDIFHLSGDPYDYGSPGIASGPAAGTGGSASLSGAANDLTGTVTITTGTLPSASDVIFTLTFSVPYQAGPVQNVNFSPGNSFAALATGISWQPDGSGDYFTLNTNGVALAASTTYVWSYLVTQ